MRSAPERLEAQRGGGPAAGPRQLVLTLSCPDRPGIVHAVAAYLHGSVSNILDSQQFADLTMNRFFMRVHVETLLMGERQRKAGKQAEAGLNNLVSKKRSELSDGGAFAVDQSGNPVRNSDNTVSLNCSNAYCDQIIAVPQPSGTGTDLVTIGWGASLPTGSQAIYTRAWTVQTLDGAKGLRRATIAVFPAGNGEPLSVLQTEAVQRN